MQMPIPTDWNNEDCCRFSVSWPNTPQWKAILFGLISQPSQGRFWDIKTGNIRDTQASFLPFYEANFDLPEVFMACNDTQMADALNNISVQLGRLADSQCCSDLQIDAAGGFQGTVTSPLGVVTPISGSVPPESVTPGEFPEGFDDLESYLLSKCQTANAIADGVLGALRALSNLTIVQFTLATIGVILGFVGAIIFPPAAFPTLFIALGILGGVTGLLFAMAELLEENRDEFVCILYEGDGSASIISVLSDFLDGLIELVTTTGPFAAALKVVVLTLLNSDTLNQLFSSAAAQAYGSADCSGCAACENITWDFEDNNVAGWEAVSSMPSCFGLAAPPLGSVSASGGKLVLQSAQQSPYYVGAMRKTGLDWEIPSGWQLDVNCLCEGAVGMYLDMVVTTTEGSCVWHTLTTSQSCVNYEGNSVGDEGIVGEHLNAVYIYIRSVSGASGLLARFETIQLTCAA